jgi:hypothetical protein
LETVEFHVPYDNIAQRVACPYLRSMAPFTPVVNTDLDALQRAEMETSQREFYDFFQELYAQLYQHPEQFGLPLGPDIYINKDGPDGSKDLQEVNRKLKSSREAIVKGIDFLMASGSNGKVKGQELVLDLEVLGAFKKTKPGAKFLLGLEGIGLSVTVEGDQMVMVSQTHPGMMPALHALAQACLRYSDQRLGRFLFTRCEFKALEKDYFPGVLDLYCIFNHPASARLASLHEFFMKMKYKTEVVIAGVEYWMVTYQGNKKIKSTPLFQVEFFDRRKDPLQLSIKCVSASRLTPFLPQTSQHLQDDFFMRKNICNGDKCNWCKDKKGLGPSILVYDGKETTICWYTNPDVKVFNDDTVELVKEYTYLHEQLQPLR